MRIGIDLGGTKIEALALGDDGTEVLRRRVPTPGGYRLTIDAIARLVGEVEAEIGVAAPVGLGTPGTVSRATGTMKNANLQFLNGMAFEVDITEALGREARIANDADCLALSEASDGAAAGADPVFAVILGTGVGGGIVADARLVRGPNGISGEWGHVAMPYPEVDHHGPLPPCYCGRTGCIETFLSGPGMAADHQRVTGESVAAPEIAAAAAAGEPGASATLDRYAERLARSLSVVINIVDPEVIVLGGGVSNVAALYEMVPARWGAYVFSDTVETRLVANLHGDSSGVRGAAWLWPIGS